MIDAMGTLALLAVISGALVAALQLIIKDKLELIVTALAGYKHRSEDDFFIFYDLMSEGVPEVFIDTIKHPKIKTKASFYKLHDEARSDIYEHFCYYRSQAMKDLMLRVLPIILLPAILFWEYSGYYLAGVAVAVAVPVLHRLLVKEDSITDGDIWLPSLAFRRYLKIKEP